MTMDSVLNLLLLVNHQPHGLEEMSPKYRLCLKETLKNPSSRYPENVSHTLYHYTVLHCYVTLLIKM